MDNNIRSDELEKTSSASETSSAPGSQNELEDASSEEPEEIEDIKVCDICGDAGLEELLAICSRCNDGAEHIYCMQKKLKELPEGDWLCEECKFKEEAEHHNADEPETVVGDLEVKCSTKSKQNKDSDSNPMWLPESDAKALESDEKEASERLQSPQKYVKMEEDKLKVDLKTSKRDIESSGGVSTRTTAAKNKSLLKESVSKLIAEAKQVKPPASVHTQKIPSGPNSSKALDPFPPRGTLSKLGSFNNSNMKPKVQFIESIPPHKQNTIRDSNDLRKGQIKKMGESASFKGIRSGFSKAEPVNKTHSLHPPLAMDNKGLKERNIVEKKIAMPERPLVNLPPKVVPEVGILSESKILDINKGLYDRENSGGNEVKLSVHIMKSLGRSTSILKPSQIAPKEDIHEIADAADASSPRISPQVAEFSHGNDKNKDVSLLGHPKQAALGAGGLLRCKKCNETGHPTQYCPIDKLSVTALKPSADRNVRDRHNRINNSKDATDAPILKPVIQTDIRLSMPSADLSLKSPFKDLGPSSSFLERTNGDDTVTNDVVDSTKTLISADASLQAAKDENNSNPAIAISDQLDTTPLPQAYPNKNILRSSAIPEHEFIWQGGFEVLRSGKILRSCEGVQAHLSTYASPKVLEAAVKFPGKVQLEEVTYLSSWPYQYQGHNPDEHNIALFFFAKDFESYEKNYSRLLDDMIKNDLALKGNIAGVELLVFPSNKLPWTFQQWNRMYFLWGVFKGRRPNCSETVPHLQEKPSNTSLDSEMLAQDIPIPTSEAPKQKLNHNDGILPCSAVENKKNHDSGSMEVDPLLHNEKMDDNGSLTRSDALVAELRPNRNRSFSPPIETSSSAANSTCETVDLNEMVDFSPDDNTREHKKMKPEGTGHASFSLASKVLSFSSVMPESSRTNESCLFPMELGDVRDTKRKDPEIPDLELALGVKKKLREQEILTLPSSDTEDDVGASLDLSLAFRFSWNKETKGFPPI